MKRFFQSIRSFCQTSAPFVAFCLVVSNFIVSCCTIRASHPRYFYKTIVITNEIPYSVTCSNATSLAGSSTPSLENQGSGTLLSSSNPGVSNKPPAPPTHSKPFRYFVMAGRRMAEMDGTHYSENDICSSGVILRIFPDKIILHDGTRIENSSLPSTLHRKERISND